MRTVYHQSRSLSSMYPPALFTHPVTVKSITAVAETFNTNAYRAFYRNVRDTTQKEKHP
jgi:hypothetical protein